MSSLTADASSALPGPEWLRALRSGAHERFASHPLPTDEEEVWRYSRIAQLDLDAFRLAAPDEGAAATRPRPLGPALEAIGDRAGLVVVRDGTITDIELDDAVTRRGVVLADLVTADGDDPGWGAVADDGTDSFTELNTAFSRGALLLRVPDGVVVDHPIVVMHCVESDGIAVFPRTIVQLGRDSEATVVEWQASDDVVAFVDPVIELDLADAARLGYINVQEWGERVWQIGYQASRVARDATLRSSVVALGGDYARVRTDSKLAGRGATSHLQAVYFGGHTQMHDFRTMQDHAAPSTNSDLLFKGAVQDRAQSVYSGLIRVRKEGERHQRLPDQSQPRAFRGRPGGVGAQPRDRGERRALLATRPRSAPSTTTSASTSRAEACPPRWPSASSCSASSPRCSTALPTQALIDTLRAAVDAKLAVPAGAR